jgi:hypothetical protein
MKTAEGFYSAAFNDGGFVAFVPVLLKPFTGDIGGGATLMDGFQCERRPPGRGAFPGREVTIPSGSDCHPSLVLEKSCCHSINLTSP